MLVLFLLVSLAAASCPPPLASHCSCSSVGYSQYTCTVDASKFVVKARLNDFAKITCKKGTLTCPGMLRFPVSTNRTLDFLHVESCALSGSIACVARALGASGVRSVRLQDMRGEVTGEHLLGLQGVERIDLDHAAAQTAIPFDVFASLPALQEVSISGSHLHLSAGPWPEQGLTELVLRDDGIRDLPEGAFSSLGNLTKLTLKAQRIGNLNSVAFKGLSKLRILDLSRNPFRELPSGVFSETPRLQELIFMRHSLELVRSGALSGLQDLETILIDIGTATLKLEDSSLAHLPSLRAVRIAMTPLALPEGLFQGSTGLVNLTMSGDELVTLPEKLFEGLTHLELLDLKDNKLSALHDQLFVDLRSLKELDLSQNQLETLPENILAGLGALVTLHLDGNRLVNFEAGTFNGPVHLQTLTLSHNQISLCQEPDGVSPFMTLLKLHTLNLSYNNLNGVCDDWRITWIHSIKDINLSWNNITKLKTKDLDFSAQVTVDFSHNEITSIDVIPSTNSKATFVLNHNPISCDCHLYPFLKFIRVHSTPKFNIEHTTCNAPSQFVSQFISDISIESLTCKESCIEGCVCLTRPAKSVLELECSDVPEVEMYPDPKFYNCSRSKLKIRELVSPLTLPTHLYSLNVSNVGLSEVPMIPDTVSEIDLRFNPLTVIPNWVSERNLSLYLPNGTLKCDCHNQEAIRTLHLVRFRIIDFDNLVCEDGKFIEKIDVDSICNVFYASIIGGILAAVGVLALVMAVLAYRYSKDLKVLIYLMGWERILHKFGITIYEEDIDEKIYDVMISYSEEKERYVVQSFVPVLEDEGYSVCVRYRDWDIGDFIPEKVAHLVEKSRRTVVFLSKDYLDSIASLELQAAMMSEKRERRKRVLIIATKDLKPDPHLKAFLDTRKSLDLEDSSFWSRLRLKLPKRRQQRAVSGALTQKTLNVLLTEEGRVKYSSKKSLGQC